MGTAIAAARQSRPFYLSLRKLPMNPAPITRLFFALAVTACLAAKLSGARAQEPIGPEATQTICEGNRVSKISVVGNLRVAASDIRTTMKSRRGATCRDSTVQEDARALWDLQFFEDIEISAEMRPSGDIILIVKVKERPAIGEVTYDGTDEVSDSDLEEDVVTLRTGEILSLPEVERQIIKIRDHYAEEGHYLARVSYELDPLPNNEVRVRFVIDEGAEVTVRRIQFVGNDHLSDSDIQAFMRTSETGFFSFLSSSNTFNRKHFDEDVQRIQLLYYDRGYLTVNVGTPRIELTPDRQYIDITIPITEGPRFRIGKLKVAELNDEGTEIEPLGGRKALREKLHLGPGDWFSSTTIREDIMEITRHYRDRGYARVQVTPRTDLQAGDDESDSKKNIKNSKKTPPKVDITVQIQRGPPVTIERINIRGNSKTRDKVIRREMRIAEGELYNQTLVENSKRRILALGYFERVDFSEETGTAGDRLVINVEVAEKPTGQFQLGAGFSSIESFILTGQVQEQNIFGHGQTLALQLQLSGIRQLIQISFIEPYLFDTEWTGVFEFYKTIQQFTDFERDTTGGGLTLGHPILHENLRLFAKYKLEYVDINARTGGTFFGNAQGLNIFQRLPLDNLFRAGFTSSAKLSLVWDSRNNRVLATDGIHTSASVEVADTYLGSENVFTRYRAFFRAYKEIFDPFVLRFNLEWGYIHSRLDAGVPIFERFRLGGIFNVRGYGLNQLGPRVGIPRGTDPNATPSPIGVPIGGNMQLYYNLELEFAIVDEVGIRGVFFLDGGNAWNMEDALEIPADLNDETTDPREGFDPLTLRHSVGLGIRWISPMGPLRFELGFPLDPRSYESASDFQFTIGYPF